MPLQFIALAKGAALVKTASTVLAEWNALAPEQKELVREPGIEVMHGLDELRKAVGERIFGASMTWEEARTAALDPSVAFVLAKRVVEVVRRHGRMSHETLAHEVGAAGINDGVLLEAARIAVDDGYISQVDDDWTVTDFSDGRLMAADHIVRLERAVVDYVEEFGLAGADTLADVVGVKSSTAPEFRAALERALHAGRVHWLEAGVYGLTPERLEQFEPVLEADDAAGPREIKVVVADVARAVDRLRVALLAVRHAQHAAVPALPAGHVPALGAGESDPLERLAKLKQLLDAGALSQEEFAEQKSRLLAV